MNENPDEPIPEVLNKTFVDVDAQMSQKKEIFAGTTVIVAFVRFEERKIDDNIVKKVFRTLILRGFYTRQMLEMLEQYYGKQEFLIFSRNGQAIRLSYDHKGTDPSESNRVKEKGGFMLNSRVNGII